METLGQRRGHRFPKITEKSGGTGFQMKQSNCHAPHSALYVRYVQDSAGVTKIAFDEQSFGVVLSLLTQLGLRLSYVAGSAVSFLRALISCVTHSQSLIQG